MNYKAIRYHRGMANHGDSVCGPMTYRPDFHDWVCGGCGHAFVSEQVEPSGVVASWEVERQATREATDAEAAKHLWSPDGKAYCHCCLGDYECDVDMGKDRSVRPDLGCSYCNSTGYRLPIDELMAKGLLR